MTPLSEYLRLVLYPLLTLCSLYGALYFVRFRWLFASLALFFAVFGVGLLVLMMGDAGGNTWIRNTIIPFAQLFLLIAFVWTFWQSHKWGKFE